MKLNKIMQIIVFVFLLIFLINSAYNYVLNNFLIKTEVIKEGVLLKGYDTQGYIFGKESLIRADSDGPIKINVTEGQRVGKKHPVASKNGEYILSPTSGLVSFEYDMLESIIDPYENSNFNFEDVKLNYAKYEVTEKDNLIKGDVIMRIQDNLEQPKLYLELPITSFKEPLQNGQVLSVKFPEEDVLKVKILKLKGLGQKALIVLEFLDMPKTYNRIQDLKIISEEIKTLLIPKESLTNVNGIEGIYTVTKGLVIFKELNIIGEEENYLLTDSLKPNTEIVLNPRFVSEGKYLR